MSPAGVVHPTSCTGSSATAVSMPGTSAGASHAMGGAVCAEASGHLATGSEPLTMRRSCARVSATYAMRDSSADAASIARSRRAG